MKRTFVLFLFGLGMFFGGSWFGLTVGYTLASNVPKDVADTWEMIQTMHPDGPFDVAKLKRGAIQGMVESLNDPFTSYMPPDAAQRNRDDDSGQFAGVGMMIDGHGERPVVGSVVEGAPAAAAGLRKGDVIVSVDGKSIDKEPLQSVVARVRGKEGTIVTIGVLRGSAKPPLEFKVTRAIVLNPSVKREMLTAGDMKIAHVTIEEFHEDTTPLFTSAAAWSVGEGAQGIILDLRNDPGGSLAAAVQVICKWQSGKPAVRLVSRNEPEQVISPKCNALLDDMPTVVLINGHSASASEVVTGALQDYGKAHVIGEKSFGKGVGQQIIDYPDGARIALVAFHWHTPKGRSIHKTGIMPDEVVQQPAADDAEPDAAHDAQLQAAIAWLAAHHR